MPGPFSRLRRKSGDDHGAAPTEATEVVPVVESTEVTVVDEPPATVVETEVGSDGEAAPEGEPGFLARGKLRRRLRYVRRAREIALRDLGGLVFDLHRFGRERGDLVEQKLAALGALDAEMRALGEALEEPEDVTVLREPGLASCPRCGALRASDASFCSTCGLPLGKGAGLPTAPTAAGAGPIGDAPAGPPFASPGSTPPADGNASPSGPAASSPPTGGTASSAPAGSGAPSDGPAPATAEGEQPTARP